MKDVSGVVEAHQMTKSEDEGAFVHRFSIRIKSFSNDDMDYLTFCLRIKYEYMNI